MPIRWTKNVGDLWTSTVGPFLAKIQPQGDGRWAWQVFQQRGEKVAPNPTATGVVGSLGAAKNVVEQFVKRSGLV